jgi:hypothetical protein
MVASRPDKIPNRSMVKARRVVSLETMVQRTSQTMVAWCIVNARRTRPEAYQLVGPAQAHQGLRLMRLGSPI